MSKYFTFLSMYSEILKVIEESLIIQYKYNSYSLRPFSMAQLNYKERYTNLS